MHMMVASDMEDDYEGAGAARNENLETEDTEKSLMCALEASATTTDSSHLAAFLAEVLEHCWFRPALQILKFTDYFETALSQVTFPWVELFNEAPLSNLIDVPLSHIPEPHLYETSVDWIKNRPYLTLCSYLLWAFKRIFTDLTEQDTCCKSQVAKFVALAIVLRSKPDTLISVSRQLRTEPIYQGQDKLPVLVWIMAQASQVDLCVGLYSWAHNLLPLVGNNKCCSPQSVDLILQLVENILSNPEAETILVNGAVREEERLIPPTSFEFLVRLTFPASSARVMATERFEAIHPLLKEVSLAPRSNAMKEIFAFSLKLAGEVLLQEILLAKEATEIAIRSLTENADCFEQWDNLYKENLEASVTLLRKLVDEWKYHSLNLSSSPSNTLTLKQTIKSFMLKNEKAITKGGANCSLYKEADKSCKVILGRLSRGSGCLKGITVITAVVLVAVGAAAGAAATIFPWQSK